MARGISARGVDELRAIALALARIDRPVRREVDRATRTTLGPIWKSTVNANATTARDNLVLTKGVSVKAGNPPTVQAATSRRRVGRGLIPTEHWAGFEYGGSQNRTSTYTRRSKNGGTHRVTRRTMRHLPPRRRRGRVLEPAVADTVPRLLALWTQTVIRTVLDAAEGRR